PPPLSTLSLHDALPISACAVPRSRDHTGARPHSRERTTRLRTTWHGAVGRLVVRRVGGGELRVALADPERHVDHDGALAGRTLRSEEHTSELQSRFDLV